VKKKIFSIFFIIWFSLNSASLYSQEQETEADKTKEAPAPGSASGPVKTPSVCEVKPVSEDSSLFTIELKNTDVNDLFRLLAHDYGINVLVDERVKGTVTATLTSISLEEALAVIAQMNNLIIDRNGTVLLVRPNLVTRTFYLNFINAEELIRQSKQVSSSSSESGEEMLTTEVISVGNTIYDLLSDQGKVFSGSQGNSLVVIDYPPQVARIEEYIKAIDTKLSSRVFKLKYISIKDLFPLLSDLEREERKKQRNERKEERDEIKEIRKTFEDG